MVTTHATQLDLDGSGAIDEFEMGEAMKSLGEYPTEEQIKAAIAEVDENGNGEVEFDEFVMVRAPNPMLDRTVRREHR